MNESILKKSEASDYITLYLKKPNLIKVQSAFLKKHRMLIEAMDSFVNKHEDTKDYPTLSFDNVDYYLGKVKRYAKTAFKNNSYKGPA